MKKILLFFFAIFIFLFAGCGRSPEAEGIALAANLSAKHLYELTMRNMLSMAHIPGVSQQAAAAYKKFCDSWEIDVDEPLQKMLKKGYPELKTTIKHEVLKQSDNPIEKNDTIYLIEYKLDFKTDKGNTYLGIFLFKIFSTPAGTLPTAVGGFEEINGKRIPLNKPEEILKKIKCLSRGAKNFVDYAVDYKTKKTKNK